MVRRGTHQSLVHQLASGADYVIDEHAVAEAMLMRLTSGELPWSAMLIAGETVDHRAARVDEDRAAARPGLA
jgi:hypothetical protein